MYCAFEIFTFHFNGTVRKDQRQLYPARHPWNEIEYSYQNQNLEQL